MKKRKKNLKMELTFEINFYIFKFSIKLTKDP